MPTLSQVQSLLSRYSGANNSFVDRLNLVRARLIEDGEWKGLKETIPLQVYSDAYGTSIVTLPIGYKTILAGGIKNSNALCSGLPLGIRDEFSEFNLNGLGLGSTGRNFDQVTGRFSVFQEWTSAMRIRLKFEISESAGTVYLSGTLDGEPVYALNGMTWEAREAIAFAGTTTVTSVKYYDAQGFKAQKPATNGRISAYTVDDSGNETLVAIWGPTETLPRYKRYRVPTCADVTPVSSTSPAVSSQFYTKQEIDAFFDDAGTITVSSTTTHDLVYAAYFIRRVRVIAQAGAGAYVASFLLDNSTVKKGGVLRIAVQVEASSNPVLQFYNNVNTELMHTISGDSSNQRFTTLVFTYNGTDWEYSGEEV